MTILCSRDLAVVAYARWASCAVFRSGIGPSGYRYHGITLLETAPTPWFSELTLSRIVRHLISGHSSRPGELLRYRGCSPAISCPCPELTRVLLSAYGPCPGFSSVCESLRWIPGAGHVPRGFCGAIGQLGDVELVLIVAEPGNPHRGEFYGAVHSSQELFEEICYYVYKCFSSGKDQFHRNIRRILDLCWASIDRKSVV